MYRATKLSGTSLGSLLPEHRLISSRWNVNMGVSLSPFYRQENWGIEREARCNTAPNSGFFALAHSCQHFIYFTGCNAGCTEGLWCAAKCSWNICESVGYVCLEPVMSGTALLCAAGQDGTRHRAAVDDPLWASPWFLSSAEGTLGNSASP